MDRGHCFRLPHFLQRGLSPLPSAVQDGLRYDWAAGYSANDDGTIGVGSEPDLSLVAFGRLLVELLENNQELKKSLKKIYRKNTSYI